LQCAANAHIPGKGVVCADLERRREAASQRASRDAGVPPPYGQQQRAWWDASAACGAVGKDRASNADLRSMLSAEKAEKQTGVAQQSVSKKPDHPLEPSVASARATRRRRRQSRQSLKGLVSFPKNQTIPPRSPAKALTKTKRARRLSDPH
jgi:hypothetical protein